MKHSSTFINGKCLFIFLCGILFLSKISFSIGDLDVTCIDAERKALVKFKQGLEDPAGRLSSWVGDDCCRWEGVSCNNRTGRVVKLNLRNLYSDSLDGDGTVQILSGKIDPSLIVLKDLNYLDLSMNDFGGSQIPTFIGSLQSLRYLNLSGASFGGTIPPSLGNLSRLVYLDLNKDDQFESTKSSLQWLSSLSSLKYLHLGGWDLSLSATDWLQTVNRLPSLLELHLTFCQLSNLPFTLPSLNFTSLMVLDLSNNGFNSTIPDWLFNLESLVYLDLNSNNLYGPLPDKIANLASLEKLDFSLNSIEGQLSKNLGKLCNLQSLKLSQNRITGEITDVLDSLSRCSRSSLETLNLGYNELTGNLPNSLGYLKSLRYLQMPNNLFQGSLPDSIGNLTSLEQISLSYNKLSGITKSLGQLSKLTVLDISENIWEGVITETHLTNLSSLKELTMDKASPNISLVFNISSDWIPPFKLTYLLIRSCQLGPKFPTWLKNQSDLNFVVLNNAMISDTIPTWFLNLDLQLNKLDIAYNQLSGRVPNSFRFNNDCTVDLSTNRYQGPLPLWSSNITMLYLRDNKFSGPIPPNIGEVMPLLTDLDISQNSLSGSIPLSIGNLTGLTTLVISNNELSGQIPHFWEDKQFLYIVDMSNNSLSGTIPTTMGSLSFLEFLILSNNKLSGEVPSSLKNCTNMVSLDLGDNRFTGKLPAWIGESMHNLLILRLRSNSFSGNIPRQFCGLSKLHIMDLSHNHLTGHIPHCISNLSGLKSEGIEEITYQGKLKVVAKGRVLLYYSTLYLFNSFDLSNNNLSGAIPLELTDLIKLGTLNLSMNHLTGQIPSSIGNLEWIETLDISMNQISGNAGLCGKPLLTECPGSGQTTSGDNEEDRHGDGDGDGGNKFEKLGFIISIVFGFFVGFWGVCGTLIIKRSWRIAYFEFVDRVKDICSSMIRRMFVPKKQPWML
ncbi:receptor-like protein EIX2 isoform X2 [Ziziphus jujuba]|uniref:Receptor-like protein EIX2 isoform X2 n=1 Tax=Ziziphus jujuba TaxID=326968 RepID=A0ABM3I017_ZIZJJ|nr:receptor-like protein EIX2 isoform X2 [Ziziphus jujuba var. spinosa]XP_048317803.1 receptor-like protein EIX2 isoform X2 [Ziziphus jujuba]